MSEFFSFITTAGLAKLAALPVGETLALTHMVVGNSTLDPTEDMTELHSEQYRGELTSVSIDQSNANSIAAEITLSSSVGGFWIREVGIIDEDGDLFAVGKYPPTYKPLVSEGTVKELGIRMVLRVSNAENVIVTYNNGIMQGAANTELSNLTPAGQQKFNAKANVASPEFTGTPTAPTAESCTNTTQIATTEFVTAAVSAAVTALINSSPAALDTLQELAAALGNDASFSTTITNALANKAAKTNDTITVATADPTSAFNVRNIKATSVDPGALSGLSNGQILLVYE